MATPEKPSDFITILPATETPPTGEQALQIVQDFLTEPTTVDLVVAAEEPQPIGRSFAFDFSKPGFVVANGGHSPNETHGLETLRGWVEKCLRTERGAHPTSPVGYGMERPFDYIGQPVVSPPPDLFDRIKAALTFHPRIADVTDYELDYDPDDEWLAVGFTVVLDDDSEVGFNNVPLVGA